MVDFNPSRMPTGPLRGTGPLTAAAPALPATASSHSDSPQAASTPQAAGPLEQVDFKKYAEASLTSPLFQFPDVLPETPVNSPSFFEGSIEPAVFDFPAPRNPLTLPMPTEFPQINTEHPILRQLNSARMRGGRDHSCVETVLTNLDRLGVKTFQGGTTADPNNPRGAMVQMIRAGSWTSVPLPGSTERTIKSPAYGNAKAHVLSADAYLKLAREGKIPNGAVVFQTQHGWNYSGGSRGNDMGIVRNGQVFNYANMGSMNVYGGALKEVVVMVPRGAVK